jgi:sulfur relay (sulfurtransferase) DsrC/TusE family protein
MKKARLTLVLAVTLLVLLNSCKDKEINDKEEQNEELTEQNEGITEHNEGIGNSLKTAVVKDGKITLNQLPANVADYVAKNYLGYEMKNAAHDPLCSGGDAIDLVITKKDSPTYSLIFLPDGTFVQLEEDIDISKAPTKVLESIKTKYSGYQIAPQIEKLTLANNTTQYLLDIAKDKITKEVIFTTDGIVACEN